MPIDGIFNIDKPVGMTSHDVVARVRRLAGQKRVGRASLLASAMVSIKNATEMCTRKPA